MLISLMNKCIMEMINHSFQTLKANPHLFHQISKLLRLSRVQEVVFGLALTQSTNSETRLYASQFVKQKLPDLLHSYVDAGMVGVRLHEILSNKQ